MTAYFLRRLLLIVPTFIGITILVFVITRFVPGGPIERMISQAQQASLQSGAGQEMGIGGSTLDEEQLQQLREYYGFDKPVLVSYWEWLVKVLQFDLGTSTRYSEPVWDTIMERLPISAYYGIMTMLITYFISIPLGYYKAIKHNSHFDHASSFVVFVGYAVPSYVIGIILLDAGIDRHYINAIAGRAAYGGGWGRAGERPLIPGRARDPHRRPAAGHGNMIARNILSLAPFATLYDAPILPPMIHDMHGFSSDAVAVLESIREVIENREDNPAWPRHDRWILVNAWAVATSFADSGAHPRYADDRAHILNRHMIDLARLEGVDIVFAAGNSGTFQPAPFSGPYDRGPARSIWGANGLPEVFTIGAVRVDGLAIGASSQGPSRPGLVDGLEGALADRNFPARGAERPGHAPARPLGGRIRAHPDGRMPSVSGANEPGHLQNVQGAGAGEDAPLNRKPDFVMPSWFGEADDPGLANSGTSAACALFAGALAALRSGGEERPSSALKAALIAGAGNGGRWNAQTGYGLPDFTPPPTT